MKIQSLSVCVPAKRCINDCKFCVAKMHCEQYDNQIEGNNPFFDLYVEEYLARLNYARDNGCNAVMLTGDCEPQQNREFLRTFGFMLRMMDKPFRQIEMQTTGTLLDDGYLRFLRNWVNVNVISVSLSSFDNAVNADITGMKQPVDIEWLCSEIKRYGFVLRLSINLTDAFKHFSVVTLFNKCKQLGADQITFRKMYKDGTAGTEQYKWLVENTQCMDTLHQQIDRYLRDRKVLRVLEYGAVVFSIDGMSVVFDTDCMAKSSRADDDLKYLILRPDCKLYSQWDDKASIIF